MLDSTGNSATSLEEKAAQLIFARLGSNMPPPTTVEDDAERVASELERYALGGLLVFNGSARTTPAVLAAMQRQSRYPLLVATDMEAGLGQQFGGATVFPHAMAYSQLRGEAVSFVARAASVAAREALLAGVHVALAPVADIHSNPQNPIISIRAFGSEPQSVSELAAEYVRACRHEGLLTAAKHFPGHGGTAEDSHSVLPVVDAPREHLERFDFVPFDACIKAGTEAIMPAHVWYSALDKVERPATFSPQILTDLLRKGLGFDGLVISDSMRMAPAARYAGGISPAVAFLAAGGDAVLDPEDAGRAIEEIVHAVRKGWISEERLDASVARVNRLRGALISRFGPNIFVDPAEVVHHVEIGGPAHTTLASEVARKAVTVVDGERNVDRVRERAETVAVVAAPSPRSVRAIGPFLDALSPYVPGRLVVTCGPDSPSEDEVWATIRRADIVVVALFVRPAAWHAFGLTPAQHDLIVRVTEERPTVIVAIGSPDVLPLYPAAVARVCSYSDMAPSQVAVVDVIFGGKNDVNSK